MKRSKRAPKRRAKRARSAPKAKIAVVARRGKYGGRKKVTRKGWQMARKKVAKQTRVKRQKKALKSTVEALIAAHEETKGIYVVDPFKTTLAAILAGAGQDVRSGMLVPYLPTTGTPQDVSSLTWNPAHFVYPLTGYGDTASTREGDEIQLTSMDNRHLIKLVWPHVDYSVADEFNHAYDEVWCIELLLRKHSASDCAVALANDLGTQTSIMKQWSMRKYGVPVKDATMVSTSTNTWISTNVYGTVSDNWKVPRQQLREMEEGCHDRIKISAPIARQRIRKFRRRDAPMRSYMRNPVATEHKQSTEVAGPVLYQTQAESDELSFPQRIEFINAGFVVPHGNEKVTYEKGSTVPRKGYEYAQIWCYRNRTITSTSSSTAPQVQYVEGRIKLRWKE